MSCGQYIFLKCSQIDVHALIDTPSSGPPPYLLVPTLHNMSVGMSLVTHLLYIAHIFIGMHKLKADI